MVNRAADSVLAACSPKYVLLNIIYIMISRYMADQKKSWLRYSLRQLFFKIHVRVLSKNPENQLILETFAPGEKQKTEHPAACMDGDLEKR